LGKKLNSLSQISRENNKARTTEFKIAFETKLERE